MRAKFSDNEQNINIRELMERLNKLNQTSGNRDRWLAHLDQGVRGFSRQEHISIDLGRVIIAVGDALATVRSSELLCSTSKGEDGNPAGFPIDLANIVFATLEIAAKLRIDLSESILQQLEYMEK